MIRGHHCYTTLHNNVKKNITVSYKLKEKHLNSDKYNKEVRGLRNDRIWLE